MHAHKYLSLGFTLIELMVTVIIVGILAAVALPAYNGYITRSRISEAVAQLAGGRMRMEQYFQDNRTYLGGTLPANTSRFTFLFPVPPDASSYTIRASGTGSMSDFSYEIDQDNARTTVSLPNGWSGEGANCWVINSGGGC